MWTFRQQIHEAGKRFYDGMTADEKVGLQCKFNNLDENGDQRISVEELLHRYGHMNRGGGGVDDRVWLLFDLVDEDRNGVLDFDECKALFFLFACGRFCDLCGGLIVRDGINCIDCLPGYFDLCGSCGHNNRHQHYHHHHRFQALLPLICSSPQQQQQHLPAVMTRQGPSFPPLQQHFNPGFPYHPHFPRPFVHRPPSQQGAPNRFGGMGGTVYGTLAVGSAMCNAMDIINFCSIM